MGTYSTDVDAVSHALWLRNREGVDPREVVELAVIAEEAGWDGVFLSDSLWEGWSHPWTIHAAIAARTDRIRLGTWITPIPRQQPWQLAYELATLDQLSDGRVICGGGLGLQEEYETYGGRYEPRELGERYDETLDIIQGLWTEDPFSYEGKHYTVEEASFPVQPVQEPRIPFVLACWWPNKKPFHRAARWDGIAPSWPAYIGGSPGPQGEEAEGSLVDQFRELMAYYHDVTDDPGELILDLHPPDASQEYVDAALELGVTWFLTTHRNEGQLAVLDEEQVRAGPPALD